LEDVLGKPLGRWLLEPGRTTLLRQACSRGPIAEISTRPSSRSWKPA